MRAFNNDLAAKATAVQHMQQCHSVGNFYAWGHYFHEGKGNITGCMYHTHLQDGEVEQDCPKYSEPVHGIPWQIMEIADTIFGGLSLHDNKEIHQQWPEMFYDSIPVGADLSKVADSLMAYLLEKPEWLASYADEECAHLVGYMQGIFTLRLNGIDQSKRIKDFYYQNIHKKHHSRFRTGKDCKLDQYAWAAMRHICSVDQHRGPVHYFLHACVDGSARKKSVPKGKQWVELSQIFMQMLGDAG